MTPLLPELAEALPADVQLDGELAALDADGRPDFHRLAARMLHTRPGIAVTLFESSRSRGCRRRRSRMRSEGRCSRSSRWRGRGFGSWRGSRTARRCS
jgi:hypothetical protein